MKSGFKLLKIKQPNLDPENFVVLRDRADYYAFPAAYYFVDYFGSRMERIYGAKISSSIELSLGAFHAGLSRTVFGSKNEFKNLQKVLISRIYQRPNFVPDKYKRSSVFYKKFKAFLDRIYQLEPSEISDKELIKIHTEWMELYAEFSFWNVVLWFCLQDRLVNEYSNILGKKYKLAPQQIRVLMTPNVPSYTMREDMALMQLALNFTPVGLAKHILAWQWLPFDYIGPKIWKEKDFSRRIKKYGNIANINKFIAHNKKYFYDLKKEQQKLKRDFKISKTDQRILEDIKSITMMQDEKKAITTYAHFVLNKIIFQTYALRFKIRAIECIKIHHEELWAGLNDSLPVKHFVPERLKAFSAIGTAKGIALVSGKAAEDIFRLFDVRHTGLKEIKGQCASAGFAKGVARVLSSAKEIGKVKRGDILITPMTTPDYILAMKKAAAIITNEGGLTSHAAIVSRELGIPCIVGTQVATKIFKDGDLLEVDASSGVARLAAH